MEPLTVYVSRSLKQRLDRRSIHQGEGPVLQIVDGGVRVQAHALVQGGEQVLGRIGGGDGVSTEAVGGADYLAAANAAARGDDAEAVGPVVPAAVAVDPG